METALHNSLQKKKKDTLSYFQIHDFGSFKRATLNTNYIDAEFDSIKY